MMKKRFFGLVVLFMGLITLAACSSKNGLDGKYYKVYEGEKTLNLSIDGNSGYIYLDGEKSEIIGIDTEKKVIRYSDSGKENTVKYKLSDSGKLYYSGYWINGETVYKEGSEALKSVFKE